VVCCEIQGEEVMAVMRVNRICHNCRHPMSSHISCDCQFHKHIVHCRMNNCDCSLKRGQFVRVNKVSDDACTVEFFRYN
jgi:hypothetical protein